MAQRTHQPQVWYFLFLIPYMQSSGAFRAEEGKHKNNVTNIYTRYMKKWRRHHRWTKTTKMLQYWNQRPVVLSASNQSPNWCQRQKICIGVYHWKNDHPDLPLRFHSNMRFTLHEIIHPCQFVFFKFVLCHSCCLEWTQCGWIQRTCGKLMGF